VDAHNLDSSVEEFRGFDLKDKQQAKARAQELTQALMSETEGVLGSFHGFEEDQTEKEVRKENLSPKERKRRKAVARGKKSRD